jgi:hypothetical protein
MLKFGGRQNFLATKYLSDKRLLLLELLWFRVDSQSHSWAKQKHHIAQVFLSPRSFFRPSDPSTFMEGLDGSLTSRQSKIDRPLVSFWLLGLLDSP